MKHGVLIKLKNWWPVEIDKKKTKKYVIALTCWFCRLVRYSMGLILLWTAEPGRGAEISL